MEYVNCYEDACKTLCGSMLFFCSKKKQHFEKNYLNYRATVISIFSLHKEDGIKPNYLERKKAINK